MTVVVPSRPLVDALALVAARPSASPSPGAGLAGGDGDGRAARIALPMLGRGLLALLRLTGGSLLVAAAVMAAVRASAAAGHAWSAGSVDLWTLLLLLLLLLLGLMAMLLLLPFMLTWPSPSVWMALLLLLPQPLGAWAPMLCAPAPVLLLLLRLPGRLLLPGASCPSRPRC